MEENVAFFPHLQESIMDELRTTEGMIFRDESAKKLFLDSKSFVLETLETKHKSFEEAQYCAALDSYIAWTQTTEEEEVEKAKKQCPDLADRLVSVTVLYAKYLFARTNPDETVSIRKPKLCHLLKGMLTRLSRIHHIRNGSFFELDPLRQDFVVRDVFRQALGNDCIVQISDMAKVVPESDDEVYPDDSISRVMERNPPVEEPVAASSSESVASKAHSQVAGFRAPTVTRVRKTVAEEKV